MKCDMAVWTLAGLIACSGASTQMDGPAVAKPSSATQLTRPAASHRVSPTTPYHLSDVAILFPNHEPELLSSLDALPALATAHTRLMDQLYGRQEFEAIVREEFVGLPPVAELEPEACLYEAQRWKLVAVRLDPFGTVAFGDVRELDRQAQHETQRAHRRVPQVRLTYQPFCQRGAERARAADAALHVILSAFQDPADAERHRALWQTLREQIPRRRAEAGSLDRLRMAEREYHEWISSSQRQPDIDAIATVVTRLRALRIEAGNPVEAMDRQLDSIRSDRGVIVLDETGKPNGGVAHPLFRAPSDSAWQELMELISRYATEANLHQVRMMSAGMGELFWAFGGAEIDADTGEFQAVPFALVHTAPETGTPEAILDLGIYDVHPIVHTPEYLALSEADRALVDQYVLTFNPQEPIDNARRAVIFEQRLNDPRRSGHSTRSCYGCHESQERTTMAMRAAKGSAPREFGYFFRAFGYVSALPFISRRAIAEAELTVEQMESWQSPQEREAR